MTAGLHSYMLDTNVFNAVLDGKTSLALFATHRLLVTGIQASELRATQTAERRAGLIAKYEEVGPILLPASSFALDIEGAGLGQAYFNDGSGNFENMLARLQQLDPNNKKDEKKKRAKHLNQLRDILIAETAIKHGATLVSGDDNLRKVVLEFGGAAIRLEQFERDTPELS